MNGLYLERNFKFSWTQLSRCESGKTTDYLRVGTSHAAPPTISGCGLHQGVTHASWKISVCLDCNLFLKFAFCTEFFPVNSTWRAFSGVMLTLVGDLELQCPFSKTKLGDLSEASENKATKVVG